MPLAQKQLKTQGLRYMRSLQIAVRTAGMLSADHAVALGPIQQSYQLLNALLKEANDLTVGFVDNRVMINNVLTADTGLAQLENEFLKRGVRAVRFKLGLPLVRYRQVIAVLSARTKAIEELGGPLEFLQRNEIEGVRIFPAGKNEKRSEEGDTLLEMDPETFFRARDESSEGGSFPGMDALAALFESAGMEKPEGGVGGPDDILKLVTPTLEAALVTQQGSPEKAYVALAQLLHGVRLDSVLAAFPASQTQEMQGLGPKELAGELMSNVAFRWASGKLASVPMGTEAFVVEAEVVQVLARSLHATQMAGKLAGKLAGYVRDYQIPRGTVEKIQDELNWVALRPEQKHAQLLQLPRYNALQFRRLMEHLKGLLAKAHATEATELAQHYFCFLELPPQEILPEELSRAPELIHVMAGVRTGFARELLETLVEQMQREEFTGFKHFQLLNALATLSQIAATHEDYEPAQIVASAVEQAIARDPGQHQPCCSKVLARLLPEASFERLVELYLEKKDDSVFGRNAASMFRRAGSAAIEVLFRRLDDESVRANRLALLRLLGRMGTAGIEVARGRLADSRWYVVRNACVLLADLKDPQIAEQLTPVLQHADDRVQDAAAGAMIKARDPGRGRVFAATLPILRGPTQENALDEIMFLKDPATLPDLEAFVLEHAAGRPSLQQKAIQAIAAIPGDDAAATLVRILFHPNVDKSGRRLALNALGQDLSDATHAALKQALAAAPPDELAEECAAVLARAERG